MAYITAQRQYHEAARVMARCERMLDRMVEHGVEEGHAYLAAGVGLADRRCLRAYGEMSRTRERLISSVRNENTVTRLKVWALLRAKQPRAANDRH
jgi:hypothetical protein